MDESRASREGRAATEIREPGLDGHGSVALAVEIDPRVQGILEGLLERAREIRPVLRADQAETERRGVYSEQVHEFFLEHGFYRMLMPLKFGGSELTVSAFYQVIAEVSRGCPSTGWCLSLAAGHSLTLGSYWPEDAQREVFGLHGYMISPASGGGPDAELTRVDGGWRVSGTWRYSSGAPYSTHFMPTLLLPDGEGGTVRHWAVIPRADFEVLPDWGRIMGMRGSGSNSIRIDDAFVPDHLIVRQDWAHELSEPTVGFRIHGNPLYSGTFTAFAEGEVAATSVGLGYAMADEYERIILTAAHPYVRDGSTRAEYADWQRNLGLALSRIDAAAAILARGGQLYGAHAARLVEGVEPFTMSRSTRLSGSYFVVEELIWEAVEMLFRTAGSRYSADGETLQRYFRDMIATRTRTDQWEFVAAPTATAFLRARGEL
ncbi:acyl-CoA dehydrogenase family protein [Leucobacter soli]|uniref:acyl-CoA dehydrogenase family protein n=1 Tax=Leucobacter soli TaxID=2812850 RepID=UPI001C404658|nr:acyl-CoA dehydrogenase family protein [Leucobacter soli]